MIVIVINDDGKTNSYDELPSVCNACPNNPKNGGSGVCCCSMSDYHVEVSV